MWLPRQRNKSQEDHQVSEHVKMGLVVPAAILPITALGVWVANNIWRPKDNAFRQQRLKAWQ